MNKTVSNILYFLTAVVLVKIIGMITSAAVARVLDPANYGLWLTLLLIVSYSSIASLGTVETLLKQFPFYVGKGDLGRAHKVEGAVLGSLFLSVLLLLAGGYTILMLAGMDEYRSVLPLVHIIMIASSLSLFSAYYYHRIIAHQDFRAVSALEATRAIATFVFLISLSWVWGLAGTAIGFLASEIVILTFSVWLSCSRHGQVKALLDPNLIWEMIKIGFPISVVFWFFMLQTSMDRIISISMLGRAATGYYGLGVSIISMVILIPLTVGRVLYPKTSEWLGKSVNQGDLELIIVKPTLAISITIPFVLGNMILLLPTLYREVFPKYVPGLLSAQILILGSFFACTLRNGVNYLVAANKHFLLLKHVLIALTVNIACNFTLVKLGLNISGIAVGTSLSSALLSLLVWKSTFTRLGYGIADQWKRIVGFYLPFLLLTSLLCALVLIYPGALTKGGLSSIFSVLIFNTAYIAIVVFLPPFCLSAEEIYRLLKVSMRNRTDLASRI